MRRRPVLITGDIGRAVALATVPVAALFGGLTIWQVYLVALVVGAFTVFFDIAYQSYLPALVGREHLVEGNGRLETNRTIASTAGPTVAGYLVQWLTAPVAVAVDAASFLWSASWIAAIRAPEDTPRPPEQARLRQRTIMWSTMPLGAVLGGLMATSLGLRPTLWITAVGALLAGLWLVFSPVTRTKLSSDLPSTG